MEFTHIAITDKGVDFSLEERGDRGASESKEIHRPEKPLAEFSDALQAFGPYVTNLLPFTLEKDVELKVRALHLSRGKDGRRGLKVTVSIPCAKVYDNPITINTPLVREGGEEPSENACVLSKEVLELIELAEEEATRYLNGEREQLELMAKSETTKPSATKGTTDEAITTGKPVSPEAGKAAPKRGRGKQKDEIPGVGKVFNAGKTEPPTTERLRAQLLAAGRDVPIDAIEARGSSDRDAAQRWADAMTDPMGVPEILPAEPLWVHEFATPSLVEAAD